MLLAPDADCCKIFTDTECELLQRVPLASEAISRIGSTDPAAMLFDAAAAFEEGDPRADEARLFGFVESMFFARFSEGGELPLFRSREFFRVYFCRWGLLVPRLLKMSLQPVCFADSLFLSLFLLLDFVCALRGVACLCAL